MSVHPARVATVSADVCTALSGIAAEHQISPFRTTLARFPVADARRPPFPTAYATRSNVIRKLKKPGGGLTVHYVKKKTKGPQTPSGDNGRIHGVSSAPSRFLGLLCGIAHGQPENGTIPTFRPVRAPEPRASHIPGHILTSPR